MNSTPLDGVTKPINKTPVGVRLPRRPSRSGLKVASHKNRRSGSLSNSENSSNVRHKGNSVMNIWRTALLDLFQLKREKEREAEEKMIEEAEEGLGVRYGVPNWYKTLGFVLGSAYVLPVVTELSGARDDVVLASAIVGGLLGCHFAALNYVGWKRLWPQPSQPINVVITGSTKGIGKALAREFLREGDRVFITSRSAQGVRNAMADFRKEMAGEGLEVNVYGTDCDVSSPASVARLASVAQTHMGDIHLWINCAGYSGSFQNFLELSDSQISQVVNTNLLGSLLCTRTAMRLMAGQKEGGHVFNTEGAGSDFSPTPRYTPYGATKAGISQMTTSLVRESEKLNPAVGIHTLSPGMVLTDLLLEGATLENKQIFNILCEQPETVAAFLVPRVKTVVARKETGARIRYLTLVEALARFATAPARMGRFFDKNGQKVYPAEFERLYGSLRKVTDRLAQRARSRNHQLRTGYSLCMVISYLMLLAASSSSA